MYKLLIYVFGFFCLIGGVIECSESAEITTKVAQGKGTISPDYSETETFTWSNKNTSYKALSFVFTPDPGYEVEKFTFDGSEYTGESFNPRLYDRERRFLTVYFKPISSNLELSIEGEGTIEETLLESKSYDTGSKIELEARPAEGWSFDRWKGVDLEDNTARIVSLNLDQDLDVTAVFKQNTVSIEMIKNENGGYWKILDADDQYLRSSDDVNNIIRDIPEGSVIKLVGTNSTSYTHTGWDVDTDVSSLSSGTYGVGHTKEYTIPYGAGKVEVEAKFQTTEVIVPGGGKFDVNNFSKFIGDLFPVFKGGYDLFKSRHNWDGLTLESTVLDAYYIGEGGNDVFTMNHHYAAEGYIDYSTFGDYKWTYTYNNLGEISAIGFNDGKKTQELNITYGDFGSLKMTFVAFLGDVLFGFIYDESTNSYASTITPPNADNAISKTYELDNQGRVNSMTITGAPDNGAYELGAEFEYDAEGKRSKATYSDGAVANYSYENPEVSVSRLITERAEGEPVLSQGIFIGAETYQTKTFYSTEAGMFIEERNESNQIISRGFGNSFTYVSMSLTVQKLDVYGRVIKGNLEASYNTNDPDKKVTYYGYFEVVDGKATWKDADGKTLSSSEVPDWMRQLTQVLDDDKPHNDFFFAYDELYYR
ncbi:MAG: InlB B-repeat-containing protein [Flavobacteriaceae bacterium]